MSSSQLLRSLLDPYDDAPLECDGSTRVLHSVLTDLAIPHSCYAGSITIGDRVMPLHFWIDLETGERIDYRVRAWFGRDSHLPHGIFVPNDYPQVSYDGEEVALEVLSPEMMKILLMPIPQAFRSL